MGERTTWTDERLDDVVRHISGRFDQVDARFDRVDARFDQVDARFDRVERRMDGFAGELADVRRELLAVQRQFATFGWGIVAAIFVQTLVAVIAALVASA